MTIHSWQFLEQSQFAIHVSKDAVLNNPYDGNDLSCTTAALWVGHLSHTGPLPFGISKPRLSQTRRCCPIKKGHTWLITCTTSCRESQYRVVIPDHRFYTNSCFLVPNWQKFQQSCAQQEASEIDGASPSDRPIFKSSRDLWGRSALKNGSGWRLFFFVFCQ